MIQSGRTLAKRFTSTSVPLVLPASAAYQKCPRSKRPREAYFAPRLEQPRLKFATHSFISAPRNLSREHALNIVDCIPGSLRDI